MATTTQYNPNADLNRRLIAAGASKTVYALITPETETMKRTVVGSPNFLEQCREAWTGKQDELHEEFFDEWHTWSAPVVDLSRSEFPFYYPTAGASEALRHLIFDYAVCAKDRPVAPTIHVFEGEYEGYKAMAEAAGLRVREHPRENWKDVAAMLPRGDMFFISQPSAIDGNVWPHINTFLEIISETDAKWNIPPRVVLDLTYVGAVPEASVLERFNMNQRCVRNVVFSLSKPFGVYYDRIGGVWCREQDLGLFGNRWFKNLSSLRLGTMLMQFYDVFYMPRTYERTQAATAALVGHQFDMDLAPSDVFILATAPMAECAEIADYLRRPANKGPLRVCLTPGMANMIGTTGSIT